MHRAKNSWASDNRREILPVHRPLFLRQLWQQLLCSPSFIRALPRSEHATLLVNAGMFIDTRVDLIRHLRDVQNKVTITAELLDLALREGPELGSTRGGWATSFVE